MRGIMSGGKSGYGGDYAGAAGDDRGTGWRGRGGAARVANGEVGRGANHRGGFSDARLSLAGE